MFCLITMMVICALEHMGRGWEKGKDTEQDKEIMGLKDFNIGFALNCFNIKLSTKSDSSVT